MRGKCEIIFAVSSHIIYLLADEKLQWKILILNQKHNTKEMFYHKVEYFSIKLFKNINNEALQDVVRCELNMAATEHLSKSF